MPYEEQWSHGASRDLRHIIDYTNKHDPDWARSVIRSITEKLKFLSDNPYLSSVFKQSRWGEVREVLAGSYRIFFSVNEADQAIRIKRIQHVRQQDPEFPE